MTEEVEARRYLVVGYVKNTDAPVCGVFDAKSPKGAVSQARGTFTEVERFDVFNAAQAVQFAVRQVQTTELERLGE